MISIVPQLASSLSLSIRGLQTMFICHRALTTCKLGSVGPRRPAVLAHRHIDFSQRWFTSTVSSSTNTTRRMWGTDWIIEEIGQVGSNDVVALGPTWLLCRGGNTSWGSGVPKHLDDKLRGRQASLPHVDVLTFGPDDDYFVQFADGSSEWVGVSEEISDLIKSKHTKVETFSLGEDLSYYCRWVDGTFIWYNLPEQLQEVLFGHLELMRVPQKVNLGPNGEWFVRYKCGYWASNGTTNKCSETIDKIHEEYDGVIADIHFGRENSWLILFDVND